jgi:hypothetical protein
MHSFKSRISRKGRRPAKGGDKEVQGSGFLNLIGPAPWFAYNEGALLAALRHRAIQRCPLQGLSRDRVKANCRPLLFVQVLIFLLAASV